MYFPEKRNKRAVFIILLFLMAFCALVSGTQLKDITFERIKENINDYKGKEVTMVLKLRKYDAVFERISFYNFFRHENDDIEFDISGDERKKKFAPMVLQLHEGMKYRVTFVIRGIGNLNQLLGELKAFTPVILEKIPEGK